MLTQYRRHAVVIMVALVTGTLMLVLSGSARGAKVNDPGPSTDFAMHKAGWHRIAFTYYDGKPFSSIVVDGHNHKADVTIYRSGLTKEHLRWSGELGYEGAGYIVVSHKTENVRLNDGTLASISFSIVEHLNDRVVLLYASVSPDGIDPSGTDHLIRSLWEFIHGGGPYYMPRVSLSVPAGPFTRANDIATEKVALSLFIPILSAIHTITSHP